MKKLVSLFLSTLLMASVSMVAYADYKLPENATTPVLLADARMAYDEDTRTISSGGSWRSYQYYCEEGDYFGGGCGAFSGKLTGTVQYSSSVGGTRKTVSTKTFSSGGTMAYKVTQAGYYNFVLKNNTSSSITVSCFAMLN